MKYCDSGKLMWEFALLWELQEQLQLKLAV